MGFNTTVLVLNDALHIIEDDPEFGKKLAQAIRQHGNRLSTDDRTDISVGGHANAATVLESHHADSLMVLAVGGNTALNLGYGGNYRDGAEAILQILAREHGFVLHKKPKIKRKQRE